MTLEYAWDVAAFAEAPGTAERLSFAFLFASLSARCCTL